MKWYTCGNLDVTWESFTKSEKPDLPIEDGKILILADVRLGSDTIFSTKEWETEIHVSCEWSDERIAQDILYWADISTSDETGDGTITEEGEFYFYGSEIRFIVKEG